MAALMQQRSILIYTHDSIGQGEDGPTHQPIEQLTALRTTPNMSVWRPCDSVETAVAWKAALQRANGPTALVLSRQGVDHQSRDSLQLANIAKGAYVLEDCESEPEIILIATGSEINICREAVKLLQQEGFSARLVSMACAEVFESQDDEYIESVLPSAVYRRVAVEAGASDYWAKYVGLKGKVVGMNRFGESAPGRILMDYFGFTTENVIKMAKSIL